MVPKAIMQPLLDTILSLRKAFGLGYPLILNVRIFLPHQRCTVATMTRSACFCAVWRALGIIFMVRGLAVVPAKCALGSLGGLDSAW
jgi:hypothetical protein